jgi:hypothetical protein
LFFFSPIVSATHFGFCGILGVNSGFNSDFKVFSVYNTGHNKYKELLPTKFQFKVDKNPTWLGSWMLLDALFHCREGSDGPPLKNVMRGGVGSEATILISIILGNAQSDLH